MMKKAFVALLVVAVITVTCLGSVKASAATEPKAKATINQALVNSVANFWRVNDSDSTGKAVTGEAISVSSEITPPAISIVVPIDPLPAPPEDVVIAPPIEVEPIVEGTGIVVEPTAIAGPGTIDGYEVIADDVELELLGRLVFGATKHGIIDEVAPLVEFQPEKRCKFGQFALMIYNAISEEGQMLNTKYARTKAVKWLKEKYGITYKVSKKLNYRIVYETFTAILGNECNSVWDEAFYNLRNETKENFPTLSLGGEKVSRVEALYLVCVTLEPDMYIGPSIQ